MVKITLWVWIVTTVVALSDITQITEIAWSRNGVNPGTAQATSTPISDEQYLANSVLDLAWIAEENQILIATAGAKIQRIDLDTEEILNTYQNHTLDDFTMALQPKGNLVASADGTGDIHIWNVFTAQTILLIPAPDLLPEAEFAVTRPVRDLAWSPNQTELAVVRADDNIIAVYNAVSGDIVRTLSVGVFPDAIFSLDWHHGHGLIALSSSDNLILNPNAMQVLVTLEDLPNTGPIIEIKWSPDGSKVAGASTSGRILVWDAESGENLYTLEANENPISSLIWHPLGDYLASGDSKGLITIWEMESGNLVEMIETSHAWINVAFSPHGGRLAFGGFLSDEVIPASSTVPNTTTAIRIPDFEVIVPNFLQGEILEAITERCFGSSSVETLNTLLRDNQLPAFVAQVEALPDGAIPPACKADLLAVVSALGN